MSRQTMKDVAAAAAFVLIGSATLFVLGRAHETEITQADRIEAKLDRLIEQEGR